MSVRLGSSVLHMTAKLAVLTLNLRRQPDAQTLHRQQREDGSSNAMQCYRKDAPV